MSDGYIPLVVARRVLHLLHFAVYFLHAYTDRTNRGHTGGANPVHTHIIQAV